MIINLIPQHDPQPDPQFASDGDSSLPQTFVDQFSAVETLQLGVPASAVLQSGHEKKPNCTSTTPAFVFRVRRTSSQEHHCLPKESEVPSDHLPTRTINTVIRSGVSSSARMGDPGRFAPHAGASADCWKNIRCGCQRPSRSLNQPCLDIM